MSSHNHQHEVGHGLLSMQRQTDEDDQEEVEIEDEDEDEDEDEEDDDDDNSKAGNDDFSDDGDGELDFEQHTARTLFPPFYNRPPTPLPPSPSLTSLLRPTFSTTTSRPATPDSSDVDVQLDVDADTAANLASITKSAQRAAPVPRASPKIPTYEYYGFAMYLASCAAFLLYIVWAYVPAPVLHQMGIHYYPNRWWALAVPCWLSVLVVYIYFALASYNTTRLTLPLPSYENLVDETGHVAVVDHRTLAIATHDTPDPHRFAPCRDVDWTSFWSVSTDAVLDVPIGGVCEVLYGSGD